VALPLACDEPRFTAEHAEFAEEGSNQVRILSLSPARERVGVRGEKKSGYGLNHKFAFRVSSASSAFSAVRAVDFRTTPFTAEHAEFAEESKIRV